MMRVVIASDTEREDLFAEIHYDDFQWAEIILEPRSERFLLTLFPPMDREHWTFPLREAEAAIAEARAALEARAYRERQ
jgi:hypothetical protein